MAVTREVAGRRYALAVAELARDHSDFAAWIDAVDGLEALTATPAYVTALQGEETNDERFDAIVRDVVPGIGGIQLNLFRLLRRKRRLSLGASIASYLHELWDEEQGVARAQVRSAVELDGDQRRRIAEQLSQRTGKTVEVEVELDPDLLGGAVIRIGDQLIDGSTRGRLRRLREQLANPS